MLSRAISCGTIKRIAKVAHKKTGTKHRSGMVEGRTTSVPRQELGDGRQSDAVLNE